MVVLIQQAEQQVTYANGTIGGLQQARRGADRYIRLEHMAEEARLAVGGGTAPTSLEHGISLDHVTFRYPGTKVDVLQDITLDLPAGSTVAVVGENGFGKTTLVKLLLAMYAPSAGEIRVDGVSLVGIDPSAWRERRSG